MTADPNWTADEAIAADNAALAADPARSDADPTLPLYQWAAAQTLETLRAQFEAGDRMALLAAIRKCANHDLSLPGWAATAYIRAYDEVLNYRSKSWDEVFGAPYPKNKHLGALRKKRMLRFAVWKAVNEIRRREPMTPINADLFERVGEMMRPPLGKTSAEEYYYSVKRTFG